MKFRIWQDGDQLRFDGSVSRDEYATMPSWVLNYLIDCSSDQRPSDHLFGLELLYRMHERKAAENGAEGAKEGK